MKTSIFLKSLPEIMWYTRLTYVVNDTPNHLEELLKQRFNAIREEDVIKIGLRTIKLEPFGNKKTLVKIY